MDAMDGSDYNHPSSPLYFRLDFTLQGLHKIIFFHDPVASFEMFNESVVIFFVKLRQIEQNLNMSTKLFIFTHFSFVEENTMSLTIRFLSPRSVQTRIQPMRFDTKGFLMDSFIC